MAIDKGSFVGKPMSFGDEGSLEDTARKKYSQTGIDVLSARQHSTEWRNRRPICPYGCGEEGNLLEVMVKDGKALGIYTHSAEIKPFTAELQMSPKPTGRKIEIGADGEPHIVEDI